MERGANHGRDRKKEHQPYLNPAPDSASGPPSSKRPRKKKASAVPHGSPTRLVSKRPPPVPPSRDQRKDNIAVKRQPEKKTAVTNAQVKASRPKRPFTAPEIWRAAMMEAVVPRPYGADQRGEKEQGELSPEESARYSLIGIGEEFVALSPEGYLIVKDNKGNLAVKGAPDIFRIKRLEPTDSMKLMRSGQGACMCRAMGMCPLMAILHHPACMICSHPMINRYYPTDEGWWDLRYKVKDLRIHCGIENELVKLEI